MTTNPVAAYSKLDSTSMLGTTYKTAIDGNSVAALRIVGRFAPHAQTSPNMTVAIDAGNIFDGVTLTEIAPQSTGTITSPTSHPRIDRIVLDNATGAVSVVAGTEAVSPVPPAIPSGKSPLAQVALTTSTTSITNAIITDERNFGALNVGGFGARQSIASASTCDLGTIIARNVLVTGTTTITSFGSTANTQSPIYLIEFAGALTLTHNGTSLILPGSANIRTAAGDTAIAEYLGSGDWRVRSFDAASGSPVVSQIPIGTRNGLKLTYSSNTAITVGTGQCADSTAVVLMKSAGYTLSVSSTGANALDTGTVSSNTWYHVFIISGSSGVASLASLSASSPSLPSGYSYSRRIGSIRTDGSSHIASFSHIPEFDTFYWTSPPTDASSVPFSGSSRVLQGLTVPAGVKVRPLIRFGGGANSHAWNISSPDEPDTAPDETGSTANMDAFQPSSGYRGYNSAISPMLTTDTSGQIGIRGSTPDTYSIITKGWIDHAGRYA